MTADRREYLESLTERELQNELLLAAMKLGWMVYHTHDSRRSHPGFPDLVLLRPPRLIFAELKSEKGRVREYQEHWLNALRQVPQVETYLWRPTDWDAALRILAADAQVEASPAS